MLVDMSSVEYAFLFIHESEPSKESYGIKFVWKDVLCKKSF